MSGVKPIDTVLGKERDATYAQCETTAKDILGDGYAVASVENQESQSYTFVGTPTIPKAIVSFRLEPGKFDPEILKIARDIHADLVPGSAPCGYIGPRPCGGQPLRLSRRAPPSSSHSLGKLGVALFLAC